MSQIWKLLIEMRKRRVFRVAGTYLVASWVLLQVADVALRPIGLPAWGMTVLVWLVIVGFPLAVILGWRYEMTPEGVVRTTDTVASEAELELHPVDYAIFIAIAIVVFVMALGLVSNIADPLKQEFETEYLAESIAVLPFEDLSPDRDQQHLAEGIADTLIHQLGKYPHLQIIARTSSFSFQGKDLDVREIARSLNSDTILEGSLLKYGDRFRVTARLVDGRTGRQVMSEEFDRSIDDIFLLQDDIAKAVARYSQKTVATEAAALSTSAPQDFASFELYILGRHHWHRRTADSLRTAIDYFQQAIRQDPTYALAWTGLADSYSLLTQYGNVPLDDVYDNAKDAIDRAFSLDINLAEAHASQGLLSMYAQDFPAADASLKRAIDLNANYAMSYVWLGRSLYTQANFPDALIQFTKALQLDPQTPITNLNVALTNARLGHNTQAREIYERILLLDPDFPNSYWGLSTIHWLQGDSDWAVVRMLQGISRGLEQWNALIYLSGAYIDLGRFEDANNYIEQTLALAPEGYWTAAPTLLMFQSTGQFDKYEALALRILRIDPEDPFNIERVAFAKILLGRYDEALRNYERAGALASSSSWETYVWAHVWGRMPLVDRAFAHLKSGNDNAADELMDRALTLWKSNEVLGIFDIPEFRYMEASIHALRGNRDEAMQALRDAYEHGWRRHGWARNDPKLDFLHDDAEFIVLMREVEASVRLQNQNLDNLLLQYLPIDEPI